MPKHAPQHAMVFAAGFGTRMQPLTDHMPKPLIDVNGKTLLDYTLDMVAASGVTHAVVNGHYLAPMIEAQVAKRQAPQITYVYESDILETGGGIVNALSYLPGDALYALNSDCLTLTDGENPLRRLAQAWDPDRMDILLLVYPRDQVPNYTGKGDFALDEQGRLSRVPAGETAPYMYIGSQILKPDLVTAVGETKFSLSRLFNEAAQRGRLYGLPHQGKWYHLSTPEDVYFARDDLRQSA